MATIKPIKALRYTEKAGELKKNVCPPYDIISEPEREKLCGGSEYNIVRLELPIGENKYKDAGALLNKWISDGILARDEQEGIFVYREEFEVKGKNYIFDGLICLVKLCDFSEKVVLPHEETLTKAKADRFNLMSETYCNFSSVYSLYLDEKKEISNIISQTVLAEPLVRICDNENVIHSLWKISEPKKLEELTAAFADKQLFIADGHHRYETALKFKQKMADEGTLAGSNGDYIMMTLVDMDDDGLVIFPTHRLIVDMKTDVDALIEKCRKYFDIKHMDDINNVETVLEANNSKHAFALYTGGDGYTLLVGEPEKCESVLSGEKSPAYTSLDVSVLHSLVLEECLGIDKENMANQINLRYTRSIDEAIDSVKTGKSNMAFIINPTKIHQIKNVSLAGEKMPQKSTYFYPKLKTGLVINKLTD